MKINTKYSALEQATDHEFMIGMFTKLLSQIVPEAEQLLDLQIPRLFAQSDNSFVIQYDVTVRSAGSDVALKLLVCGELSLTGTGVKTKVKNENENAIQCDQLPLTLRVFPDDPSLPALSELTNELKLPESISASIEKHLSAEFSLNSCTITPLGWRFSRRAVVKIETVSASSEACIIKFVRQKKARNLFERIGNLSKLMTANKTPANFVIPEIISVCQESGMIVFSAVEGETLYQLINDDRYQPGAYQAGRLLLDLHRLDRQTLPFHSWANELELTKKTVDRTIELFKGANELLSDQFEKMYKASGMLLSEADQAMIHRDFYDKQFIPGDPRPALLDLDNLSLGDPAQDVGNFLAHCDLRMQQFPGQVNLISDGMTAFLAGYGTTSDEFSTRVANWKKLTLVRLTCLYLLRPKWRGIASGLLQEKQPLDKTELQPRGNI